MSSPSLPKYRQIAESILKDLERSGGRLTESQTDLAARFKVNRLTLRHALDWLEREGRLTRLSSRSYGNGRTQNKAPVVGFPIWTDSLVTLNFQRTEARLRMMRDIHWELDRQGYRLDPQFVGPQTNPNLEKIRQLCEQWSAVVLEPWEGESRIVPDHPFEPLMDRAVFIGAIQDRKHNCVCPDFYSAGQLAIAEFARLGIHKILFTGRQDETISHRLLRLISAEDAASQYRGVEVICADGGFHLEESFSAVKRYFLEGGQCDALLTESSYATSGALRALADLGIRVPDHIQLICLGGGSTISFLTPRPTAISTEPHHLGQEIARMALALSKDARPRPNIMVPMHLIQGETTGTPAPASAPRGIPSPSQAVHA